MNNASIFIGRFQPFHNGHLFAVKEIINNNNLITIAIGSSQLSHQIRNPFTFEERMKMIQKTLENEKIPNSKFSIIPLPDSNSHSEWINQLNSLFPDYDVLFSNDPLTIELTKNLGKISKQINLLSRWKYSATEVRDRIYNDQNWKELVPDPVIEIINDVDGVNRIKKYFKQPNKSSNVT